MIFVDMMMFVFVFNSSIAFSFLYAIKPCVQFVIVEKNNIKKSGFTKTQILQIIGCKFQATRAGKIGIKSFRSHIGLQKPRKVSMETSRFSLLQN